jgi:protein O-mannosyl-transferase
MPEPLTQFRYRLALIVIIVAAVYAATVQNGFVWDDTSIIVNNPLLENLGNIPRMFLSEDSAVGSTGYYRPVTYVSFALDRAIWGVNPAGYHLTNLVLHIVAVLLFSAVIAALFKRERLAFIAALIFALHPLAGETVNFLAGGRNTLLSACFALLSLSCYIRKRTVPAVASFTVAIFSKEFALMLPVVFLFHDWRLAREKIRWHSYIPYLIPVACYLILRSLAVQKANFISAINAADAMKAPYLVVRYVLNMIFPFHLKVLYDVHPGLAANLACLAAMIALAAVVYLFRKRDEMFFASFWFLLFLLPVINVIPLESASLMADRYAYFSLMGFALILADLVCRGNGRAVTVGVVTLCAVFSFVDVGRTTVWKDGARFFTRMTEDAPEKFDGFQNLGMYYYKKGDTVRAVRYLEAALSKPEIPACFLIGSASVLWKENMLALAEKSLLRALELEPANPEPYLMLITMYERNGYSRQAASARVKAEGRFPDLERRMARRTVDLYREGERYLTRQLYVPAENVFWQALMIEPDFLPALVGMGRLSVQQGDLAHATGYFVRTLALDPSNAPAHYNLSLVYERQGRFDEARQEMIRFRESEGRARQKGDHAPR